MIKRTAAPMSDFRMWANAFSGLRRLAQNPKIRVSHRRALPRSARPLAFPSYDGNGMYLSLGNIAAASKVGMLFIDFTTPHRVRMHGDATVSRSDPLLDAYYGAEWIVRVAIAEIFVNCARYIHRYERRESSKYVPQPDKATPFPQWKRIDVVQDALPMKDQGVAKATGGTITVEEYGSLLAKGKS